MINKCEKCGKEFEKSRKKIYCSKRCLSQGISKKMGEIVKGRRMTEETREKISKAHKGKKLTDEHKRKNILQLRKLAKARIGTHLTEETKRKIGEKNKVHMLKKWNDGVAYEEFNVKKRTGGESHRKGVAFEKEYGVEKAKELKCKLSQIATERLKSGGLKKFILKKVRIGKMHYTQRKGVLKPDSHWVWFDEYSIMPKKGEVIHHRDFNEENNHISNLQLMTRGDHTKFHLNLGKV